ncbi:MAG: amino acid adenylation domain-containing protein [Pseudonocardiaceae bacterium]
MQKAEAVESDRKVEPASILELFEKQVVRVPDQLALQWEQGRLTYRHVAKRVQTLAQVLLRCGVEPGRAVAVAMPRGPGAVIGILAVWTVGGVYVPVDPGLPSARARLMRAETEPCCVLAQFAGVKSEWIKDVFQELPAVAVDDFGIAHFTDDEPVEGCDRVDEISESAANSPAYVLYTSGSTGRPKGVLVEHQAILNYVTWLRRYLSIDEFDRVLLQTALSFDVSIGQCFAPLVSGACVVLARPGGERDPEYVRGILQSQDITIVHFVPSALRVFLANLPNLRFSHLRALVTSGERLSEDLERACLNDHGFTVHNLYGPTEASVDATYHRCRGDGGDPPIGRPVSHATVYLLDPDLNRIDEPGVTGEIFLGGRGLARGYIRQPGQTAQRFVADPYGPAGSYMYRTGDRGRWNYQGELEFVDRIDNQVQISGHRIELGEV